jgi:hypothetical protein
MATSDIIRAIRATNSPNRNFFSGCELDMGLLFLGWQGTWNVRRETRNVRWRLRG